MSILWLKLVSCSTYVLYIYLSACELNIYNLVDLRNAVDFLEFAETYSACQLKKSCFEFICVNASFFLEER